MYMATSVTVGLGLKTIFGGTESPSLWVIPINTKAHIVRGISAAYNAVVAPPISRDQLCRKTPQCESEKAHFLLDLMNFLHAAL